MPPSAIRPGADFQRSVPASAASVEHPRGTNEPLPQSQVVASNANDETAPIDRAQSKEVNDEPSKSADKKDTILVPSGRTGSGDKLLERMVETMPGDGRSLANAQNGTVPSKQIDQPEPAQKLVPRHHPEPGSFKPEPDPEPGANNNGSVNRFGDMGQFTEPNGKSRNQKTSQFTEPVRQFTEPSSVQFTEPDPELGQELDASTALSADRRLWNLETYGDRHGKRRLRRSLRFVRGTPERIELGKVTQAFSDELNARPGRGRWANSRAESELYRPVAESIAESARRAKRQRRKSKNVSQTRRNGSSARRRKPVSEPPTNAQWDDMPSLLM